LSQTQKNICTKSGQRRAGNNCNDGIARRDLLKFGAASIIALGSASRQARAADGPPTALSPDEALAALKSGNERYVSHPELCSIDLAKQRSAVTRHRGRRLSVAPTVVCRQS
jgi:hypothetical protein